jgi:hypothetical protein
MLNILHILNINNSGRLPTLKGSISQGSFSQNSKGGKYQNKYYNKIPQLLGFFCKCLEIPQKPRQNLNFLNSQAFLEKVLIKILTTLQASNFASHDETIQDE